LALITLPEADPEALLSTARSQRSQYRQTVEPDWDRRQDPSWFILDYRLGSATGTGETELNTPSNAVVIPADSDGPVEIILESSTDLITWTAALPGSYASTTEKRFFRVRALRSP
jgi:hypothetical protein